MEKHEMSLMEIIESYRYFLRFHDKETANSFLSDVFDREPLLIKAVQETFNSNNDLARADSSTFYWKK